jgi:mycofactocin system transcriptional regulator
MPTHVARERPGRPRVTSRADIERAALDLFAARGFDETTVDDIAEATGISRRTFFRYYRSKNDVVWGDFDALLGELESRLAGAPTDRPIQSTRREEVVRFNSLPPEAVAAHRQRMALILYVPALQAHSTLRYARWRAVVAQFAARRLGVAADGLGPQLVGHVALAAAVAAYEQWLTRPGADLAALLDDAFGRVTLRFAGREDGRDDQGVESVDEEER